MPPARMKIIITVSQFTKTDAQNKNMKIFYFI